MSIRRVSESEARRSRKNILGCSNWLQLVIRIIRIQNQVLKIWWRITRIKQKVVLDNSTISLNSTLNHVALLNILSVSLIISYFFLRLPISSDESSRQVWFEIRATSHEISSMSEKFENINLFTTGKYRIESSWKRWKLTTSRKSLKQRKPTKHLTVKYHKLSRFSFRFDSYLVDFDCQVSSFTHSNVFFCFSNSLIWQNSRRNFNNVAREQKSFSFSIFIHPPCSTENPFKFENAIVELSKQLISWLRSATGDMIR